MSLLILDASSFEMLRCGSPSVHFLALLRSVFMIVRLTTNPSRFRSILLMVVAVYLGCALVHPLTAQTADAFGDSGADPVKLFDQGQNAHARGDLAKDPAEKVENYK